MKLLNLMINGHKSNSRKASGGLTVEGGGGFIIGCICCLQVDRPITGGVAGYNRRRDLGARPR